MWITLEDGRRRRVRQEDAEMLHCAIAQENPEAIALMTMEMMMNSKDMVSDLARGTFHLFDVGWEQAIADLKYHGFNERYLKYGH